MDFDTHHRIVAIDQITEDGIAFTMFITGRRYHATITATALTALQPDSTSNIGAFWNNGLKILRTAARMIDDNPTLTAIHLNSRHFF
jgi:hypothetical protein